MSMILAPNILAALKRHGIANAARFDGSTGYLSRTPPTAGNRKTWTFSAWVLRAGLTNSYMSLLWADPTAYDLLRFNQTSDILAWSYNGAINGLDTNAVYRDASAWMHIVLAVDTTQATTSDRFKLYVNGAQVTSLSSSGYPAQNTDVSTNNAVAHNIGRSVLGSQHFDGYMADVHFIDGQALTPSDFGKADKASGNWIAKAYGGSHGANGFHLDFSDPVSLGKDVSGSGNDWAVTGGVSQVASTPTDTAATLCPLSLSGDSANIVLSDGNRKFVKNSTGYGHGRSTLKLSATGKWWTAFTYTGVVGGTLPTVGIGSDDGNWKTLSNANTFQAQVNRSVALLANGSIAVDGVVGTTYSAAATGYVGHVAVDMDTGETWVGMDSGVGVSWFGGGDPALGTAPTVTGTWSADDNMFVCISSYQGEGVTFDFAADDATAPSGFRPLRTDNLSAVSSSINDHFKTVTYTGDGTTAHAISGLGFAPGFVWTKSRSSAYGHSVIDGVRGVGQTISVSSTASESDGGTTMLQSFDADGFTIGSSNLWNANGATYVSWCARLPGQVTSGWAGSPSITPSEERYNAELGMSIVAYTGNGTAGATIPHSLGVAPGFVVVKCLSATGAWAVYHSALGATKAFDLNGGASSFATSTYWNDTAPTADLITLGANANVNANGAQYVAYVFAPSDFIKIGSYINNGLTNGPMLSEMISPAWGLFKSDSSSSWYVFDDERAGHNPVANYLLADIDNAEGASGHDIDFTAVGAKLRTGLDPNYGSYTSYYMMVGQPVTRVENTAC